MCLVDFGTTGFLMAATGLFDYLSLKPGDRLVVQAQRRLTADERHNIRESLKLFAADVPVLVIDHGLRLAVLSKEEVMCG